MNSDRYFLAAIFIAIICVTGLIAQCSNRLGECQMAAIKANITVEDAYKICRM